MEKKILTDALKNKTREIHEYKKRPLNADITYESDFSDNDIYSPLQPMVNELLQSLGYADMKDFAKTVLASHNGIVNSIDDKNFEKLCQIGIVCKAIYKDQGFNNTLVISKEDVEYAYSSLFRDVDSDENNGGDDRR